MVKRILIALALSVPIMVSVPFHEASASLGACGSDPTLYISNGATVAMTATIQDASSNIVLVGYKSSGPVGTSLYGVDIAAGSPRVQIIYSPVITQTGYYGEQVYVQDANSVAVAFTATVTIAGVTDGGTASGTTNEWISIYGN